MGIRGMKWGVRTNEKAELKSDSKAILAAVVEVTVVMAPTLLVVGCLLWIARSAGIELVGCMTGVASWLSIVGSIAVGIFGTEVKAMRALWARFKDSDILTEAEKAEWPDWLK